GAIPDSLIDSELFGHEKGAFTGALSQKRGRFERADKGTIFLDEIGEIPMHAQIRLLRVLQNHEIERVGGTETIVLDIRIIAATNKDPETLIKDGKFRLDLFYRLNVFPIHIPPLRDRKTDILLLAEYFILQKSKELKLIQIPELKPDTITSLLAYDWPGNVRELQNIVERALILHREGKLSFDKLVPVNNQTPNERSIAKYSGLKLDDVTRKHILYVLGTTNGKIHGPGGAGELLAMNPNTLRNRMKKLGIAFGK
ncbi:MAG: sigma-54-dependent Fis family transcriptional regulator, partial [Candidatus Heimdallarchaeota archaeon]|nr:sigma-54-dependent Fis family transcriptional regulator [Candidatus Heimdallarchaeota archaeon]